MTTVGWIIWFSILGVGSLVMFAIAVAVDRAERRHYEEQERRDEHNARVVWEVEEEER